MSNKSDNLQIEFQLDANHQSMFEKLYPESLPNVSIFSKLLITDMLEMLTGAKQYSSLPELFANWIFTINTELSPENEITLEQLTRTFGFPLENAKEILRIIDRHQKDVFTAGDDRELESIFKSIETAYNSKDCSERDRFEEQEFELNSAQLYQLEQMLDQMSHDNIDITYPRIISRNVKSSRVLWHINQIQNIIAVINQNKEKPKPEK